MDKGWKWEKEGRVQSEKKGSVNGGKSGYELKVGKKGRGLRVGKRGWAHPLSIPPSINLNLPHL
jgi:hypothetical protein